MEIKFIQLKSDPDIKLRIAQFPTKDKTNSGKTIVVIPGYFGAIEERKALAKKLSEKYNTIVLEPRGYGKSSKKHKRGIYTVPHFAEEMREVFQHLNLKDNKFVVFGSSLAVSALHQYSAYLEGEKPEPAALFITSPAPKYRESGILKIMAWMPNWLIAFIQKLLFIYMHFTRGKEERKNLVYAKRRFKELDPWVQRRIAVEAIGKVDFRDGEKDMKIPLCIFIAEKDDFTDPEDAKKYMNHEKSEINIIETSAHKFIEGNENVLTKHIFRYLSKKIWPKK